MIEMIYSSSKQTGCKIHLPVDVMLDSNQSVLVNELDKNSEFKILDIAYSSHIILENLVKKSDMILWNGPMGVFEIEGSSKGTFAIAKAVAEGSGISIIGGGGSVKAINPSGYGDQVTFMSTGGGASLEFLEGKDLPGVSVLDQS